MFLKIMLFLTLSLTLFAQSSLKGEYYILDDKVKLSTLVPDVKNDKKLFTISRGKYTKRVKSTEVIELLKKNGELEYNSKHRYIQFTKKSPIDTSKIEKAVEDLYRSKYLNINIRSIEVRPRSYLTALPQEYEVSIHPKNYLKSNGILSIKTKQRKQLFFNFSIDAEIYVYKTRKDIKRNSELSHVNCVKNSIILDKLRAMPIQKLVKGRLQSKNQIKMDSILTLRDVKELNLVKRGSTVNVTLRNSNIDISFSGKALKNGSYGDVIKVQQSNSKVLKVRIIAKGRGEVI